MHLETRKAIGQSIQSKSADLAEAITARHYELKPELTARYGERGRGKCLEDARYHLSHLSEAISAASPELFDSYVGWAKVLLAGYGIGETDLSDNLAILQDVLQQRLPAEESEVAAEYIVGAIKQLKQSPPVLPSCIRQTEPLADLAREYLDLLLNGERQAASRLILDKIESGTSIKDIYLFVFQRTQHEIGRLWQMSQLSVAQEHYCTAATQMIMSQMYPYLFTNEKTGRAIVISCVAGDLHEIGGRMVSDLFEMEGWDTYFLGSNMPNESLLDMVADRKADLIGISATMTFHIRAVEKLIDAIRSSDQTKHVKIMVGGFPFNTAPDLYKDIGADATTPDITRAIEVADSLLAH